LYVSLRGPKNITTNNIKPTAKHDRNICLKLILPINIIKQLVPKSIKAVEKFAGAINPITKHTDNKIGKNDFLKSFMFSCRRDNSRAKNIMSASFAKSDD
jgi:hypothetical protein